MHLEIRVDRNRCIGSGQCVHWAPGVFTQDEEAISVVVDPRGEPEEKIVMAVNRCPVGAISLRIDGIDVESGLTEDWHRGSLVDSPVVALLERLGNEHDTLRASLAALRQCAHQPGVTSRERAHEWNDVALGFGRLLSAHCSLEEQCADPAITALVGGRLVEVFEQDHATIKETAGALCDPGVDPVDAVDAMASALDAHMRLEETVLFPMVLGILAEEASPNVLALRRGRPQ